MKYVYDMGNALHDNFSSILSKTLWPLSQNWVAKFVHLCTWIIWRPKRMNT